MKQQLSDLPLENLVCGRRGVEALLLHNSGRVEALWVAEGTKLSPELRRLLKQADVALVNAPRKDFDGVLGEVRHQGIVAVVKTKAEESPEDIAQKGLQPGASGVLVILDQVSDPQNLGAVLRAAEASGVDGMIITRDHSAGLSPAAKKASAGASELVPIAASGNLQRTLEMLKEKGFWIVGTALSSESTDLYHTELPHPCALVFGSEGKGLRKLTKKLCDILVEIPMQGRLQSLNISQAASVVLFELLRRRENTPDKQ